jgi:hypothetical protein
MRRAKQIIYGAFYLIIFGAIFTGFYVLFLKPAPAPPCTNCLPANIQPITAGMVTVFKPVADHATLLVRIANWNTDVAAGTFDYTFTAYDASGKDLGSVSGSSFAYPNETKYIVMPNETVSGRVARADFTVGVIHWVSSSTAGLAPEFAFKNLVTAPILGNPGTLAVSGEITNEDNAALKNIVVVAIFKDQYGNPAGASQTVLDGLAPQETQNFSVSYPALPNINPSATEVYAYSWR